MKNSKEKSRVMESSWFELLKADSLYFYCHSSRNRLAAK
jgi:hypothetical protein